MLALTKNQEVTKNSGPVIGRSIDPSPLPKSFPEKMVVISRDLKPDAIRDSVEVLKAQSARLRIMAQPNTADTSLFVNYLHSCLGNKTKSEVERLKEMFRSLFGNEFPSLEQLAKSSLTGRDADVAIELINGFEGQRSADSIFRALSQQEVTRDGDLILDPDCDRIKEALIGFGDDYRSIRDLSSILLSFEFPYQQSLYVMLERVMPDFLDEHPTLSAQLESRTTPRLRMTPDMTSQISTRFRWPLLRLMPESIQSRVYVISKDMPDSDRRRGLDAFLRVPSFCNSDLMTQQILLHVFFALSSSQSRRRFIVTLLEKPYVLLDIDDLSRSRAIDEMFSFLFAPLHPSSSRFRAHILEVMVLALRGPWHVSLPPGLEWLFQPEVSRPLLDRRWAEFCRIIRELASPSETTWYKQPLTNQTIWINKKGCVALAA